jgi:hypothetical protein
VNHDSEATMVLDGACLDPQEYGLLAGFGFALFFGAFGIFRWWRGARVVCVGCFCWGASRCRTHAP